MSRLNCLLVFLTLYMIAITITSSGGADAAALNDDDEQVGGDVWSLGRTFVKREERRRVFSDKNGEITAARVSDGVNGTYHLQIITLEPTSLFLPVLLHADMVFYVASGTGTVAWNDEDKMKKAEVVRGDVHRLNAGTVFFAQSSLTPQHPSLRIFAIFANSNTDLREPAMVPYTSISDLVLGFDMNVLQAAFQVSEEVIRGMLNGTKPPAIVHGESSATEKTLWEMEMELIKEAVGLRGSALLANSKNKKLYNLFKEDKDFQNCNGWSLTVTRKDVSALKSTDFGVFMVNLTKGSMMGPHWNPMATEIAIVLQGQGMVRVVCPKTVKSAGGCQNMRINVNEGDVFVVPKFHPMAQMSFNNNTFVFVGFSTSAKNNHPQFVAGKASVLRTLNKGIVAASFNVTNTTIDQLLASQGESVILECTSCAEEELRILQEEAAEREEEAAREREEEERRQREQEEATTRREEEERRQREQGEATTRREEEERRQREKEAAAQRKEEEAIREEEEARRAEEEWGREEREAEEGGQGWSVKGRPASKLLMTI